jgi:hypothetical protein
MVITIAAVAVVIVAIAAQVVYTACIWAVITINKIPFP